MKILCVIDSLGSGGAQRQLVLLAKGLKSRGHDVYFFIYHPEYHFIEELRVSGVEINVSLKEKKYSLKVLFDLFNLIKSKNINVVISFLETPSFYCEIIKIVNPNILLIVSERFMYLPGRMGIKKMLYQQMHRFADAITVNSHHQYVKMIEKFSWMRDKISVIYNGYDLNKFNSHDRIFEISMNIKILAIGSIAMKKNPLNLARAINIVCNRNNVAVVVNWVGSSVVSDDTEDAFLKTKSYLHEHNLQDKWNWLGVQSDIPSLMKSHDVLVHPSYFEGLPNVICEALACGCPVLASNVCDHPRLVEDTISGYLFDPDSPESIAIAIMKFFELSIEKRTTMSGNARGFATVNLSMHKNVDLYENLITKMLDK